MTYGRQDLLRNFQLDGFLQAGFFADSFCRLSFCFYWGEFLMRDYLDGRDVPACRNWSSSAGREPHILRRLFLGAFLITLVLSFLYFPINAKASADPGTGKIIYLVYDDSNSMHDNGKTRWSIAKYAMEVFGAMLTDADEMHIYPMSMIDKDNNYNESEILVLKGSDSGRVTTIRSMDGHFRTPVEVLQHAGDDLLASGDEREKWLVLITDGKFNDPSDINSPLDDDKARDILAGYNDQGLNLVYLGIGDQAPEIAGDPDKGFFTYTADDGQEVIEQVTSVANQIFDHQILPDNHIQVNDKSVTLDIDIPTSQIVVFAQGDNPKVGALTQNGVEIQPTDKQPVQVNSDDVHEDGFNVEPGLNGIVYVFEAGDKPFSKEQLSLTVDGASSVQYYFKPGVIINTVLKQDDVEAQQNDRLYRGEYAVELNFIDPTTGEVLTKDSSDLLSDAQMSLTVNNNGNEQTFDGETGTITLEQGTVDISASAYFPTSNVSLTSEPRTYEILPDPEKLTLEIDPENASYTPDQLGPETVPYTLTVTHQDTGEVLTEEEWNNCSVTVGSASNVKWTAEKGGEVGTFLLRPIAITDSYDEIPTGESQFAVSADYEVDKRVGHGAVNLSMTIGAYQGTKLVLTVEKPEKSFNLFHPDGTEEPVQVRVQKINAQNGEAVDLTKEEIECLQMTGKSGRRVGWKVTNNGDGTFGVEPTFYTGIPLVRKLITQTGQTGLTVTAAGETGQYRFEGTGETTVDIMPKSLFDIILNAGLLILILAALIGYFRKCRFPRGKSWKRYISYKNSSIPVGFSVSFLSMIYPWCSETGMLHCYRSGMGCTVPNLKLKAVAGRTFVIVNYKSINIEKTKIGAKFYKQKDDLKEKRFGCGSTMMTSCREVNGRMKEMGVLHF